MKKVLIIDGSMRNGFTTASIKEITEILKEKTETSSVRISELEIETCKGCCVCLFAGEEKCPSINDDSKMLLDKIREADGIIMAVPNYSLQVPGKVKTFLDRAAFVFHRPELFGRTFMPVVVQGILGGGGVVKYLNKVMDFFGMATVKGAVLSGGVYAKHAKEKPLSDKNMAKLKKACSRFLKELSSDKPRKPSLMKVIIFRATRSSMKHFSEALPADREYYSAKGWLDAPYYYPVDLGIIKSALGALMDRYVKSMAVKAEKAQNS